MAVTATVSEFVSKNLEKKYLPQSELRMVLFSDRLEYAILLANTHTLLKLGTVPFSPGQPLAASLEHAVASTPHLSGDFAQRTLLLALPLWTLVPQDFLAATTKLTPIKFIETLHGIDPDHFMGSDVPVSAMGLRVVFAYPNSLTPALGQLTKLRVEHVVARVLEVSRKLDDRVVGTVTLHITLMGGTFLLTLIRKSDLIFCNAFEAAHAEDALYYVASTLQQLGTELSKVAVYITGHAPYRAALEGLLAQTGGEVSNVRSQFTVNEELVAAGSHLDEVSYFGDDLLVPGKV